MSVIPKSRLEAFSDGVIAIIITIMVLEMKVPHSHDLGSLKPLLPVFLNYILSFIFVGIYWNNHHHLLHATKHINGSIMWANLHLLFWLSMVPFVTSWLGENHDAAWPTALYGTVLFMAAIAYTILLHCIVLSHGGRDSYLLKALEGGWKEKLSVASYLLAIGYSFINHWVSDALYILVAAIWLIPDTRIEKVIAQMEEHTGIHSGGHSHN